MCQTADGGVCSVQKVLHGTCGVPWKMRPRRCMYTNTTCRLLPPCCVHQKMHTCAQAADVGEHNALRVAIRDVAPPLLAAEPATRKTVSAAVQCLWHLQLQPSRSACRLTQALVQDHRQLHVHWMVPVVSREFSLAVSQAHLGLKRWVSTARCHTSSRLSTTPLVRRMS